MALANETSVQQRICPACHKRFDFGQGGDVRACPRCGFMLASVRMCAGPQSERVFLESAHRHANERQRETRRHLSQARCLGLGGGTLLFVNPQDHVLWQIDGYGSVSKATDIMQASASLRHTVLLRQDGTVYGTGDNDDRQLMLGDITGATRVLADKNTTYVVLSTGRVAVRGSCTFKAEVEELEGVRDISCGAHHVAALMEDGRVRFACSRSELFALDVFRSDCTWQGVIQLASSDRCTVGLTQEGRVLFAGDAKDVRSACTSWANIEAIDVDSGYVVGLTRNGRIRLESSVPSTLDAGRSEAALWDGVLAVACSQGSIVAIRVGGELLIAGALYGSKNITAAWRKVAPLENGAQPQG